MMTMLFRELIVIGSLMVVVPMSSTIVLLCSTSAQPTYIWYGSQEEKRTVLLSSASSTSYVIFYALVEHSRLLANPENASQCSKVCRSEGLSYYHKYALLPVSSPDMCKSNENQGQEPRTSQTDLWYGCTSNFSLVLQGRSTFQLRYIVVSRDRAASHLIFLPIL